MPARALRLLLVLCLTATAGAALPESPVSPEPELGGPPPSEIGAWGAVFPFPQIPIHTHLLPTGRILFWDRHDMDRESPAGPMPMPPPPQYWDPATGQFSDAPMPPEGHDLFCSGHSFLADGRLFVAGGHILDTQGQAFAAIFDPWLETWQAVPPMNAGRWYPSVTTLANGDALVLSGSDENSQPNRLPQIYRPDTNDWRGLTGAELDLPYYPLLFVESATSVVSLGPHDPALRLDLTGNGQWTVLDSTGHGFREHGSAAALGDGRLLFTGGGNPPTASAQLFELGSVSPLFVETEAMAVARRHLDLTLLPDGTALATGGTAASGFNNAIGAVFGAELWEPSTETWRPLASMSVPRLYHSIAILLPDASVLVAGGGHPASFQGGDTDHFDGQIFSPPYLFRGLRPTIAGAPSTIALGRPFTIETGGGPAITRATLVRLGSVTHAFDMNQRFVELVFTPNVTGGIAVAPSDPSDAPPGHYLLFVLDAVGVPSVARIVRLDPGIFGDGFETGDRSAWSATAP